MNISWTLAGHFSRVLGVGEAGRRLNSLLRAANIQTSLEDPEIALSKSGKMNEVKLEHAEGLINLISCVNPDQLGALLSQKKFHPGRLNRHIGFWSWELGHLPEKYEQARSLIDETWTVSTFCQNAFSCKPESPVRTVKLPVPIYSKDEIPPLNYAKFGLNPNMPIVTVSFDFFSDVRRKNPASAIRAFRQAFGQSDEVQLFVKSINGDSFKKESQKLRQIAGSNARVVFFDGYMSKAENIALLSTSEVYLSLHRSEGYGINLADAMALGTPVIATGYSGNLDYMDDDSAVLVPYQFVSVRHYAGIRVNDVWAEPDEDFAAKKMRLLIEDEKLRRQIGQAGHLKILSEHALGPALAHFERNFLIG